VYLQSKTPVTAIDVYDDEGKRVLQKNGVAIKEINLNNLSSGSYFIKLYGAGFTDTKRIIKR